MATPLPQPLRRQLLPRRPLPCRSLPLRRGRPGSLHYVLRRSPSAVAAGDAVDDANKSSNAGVAEESKLAKQEEVLALLGARAENTDGTRMQLTLEEAGAA